MGIFELLGAVIVWTLSGFNGKPNDKIKPEMNFKLAYLGLFSLLTIATITLIIAKIIL